MPHHRRVRSLFAIGLALLVGTLAGCTGSRFVVTLAPANEALDTTTVRADGHWGSDRVVIIDISGTLTDGDRQGLLSLDAGENPVSTLDEKLQLAADDPKVKAVILRLNTPGGGVTASDIMYQDIERFRRKTHKPVIALAMDLTASGGYYVSCAADQFIVHRTSVVGSIGVIVQTISFRDALDRIGIHPEAIVSGPNKEVASPLVDMTDSQRRVLRRLVDDFYHRFREVVRKAHPAIPADKFDELTDGRVLSGTDAVKAGLADAVGNLDDAFALAKHLAGIKSADLIMYHRPMDYVGSPYADTSAPAPRASAGGGAGGAGSIGTQVNLAQFNLGGAVGGFGPGPGFYYLWTAASP